MLRGVANLKDHVLQVTPHCWGVGVVADQELQLTVYKHGTKIGVACANHRALPQRGDRLIGLHHLLERRVIVLHLSGGYRR